MAINAGPSGGFMGRLKQGLPGAINAAGSMMPGPFGQTAKIASNFMRKPKGENTNGGPTNPMVQGKQTTQQNGPGGMPPTGPNPFTNGLTRGMTPGRNTGSGNQFTNGLTSGIVRGPSMPMPGMGMPPAMQSPMAPGGGTIGGGAPGMFFDPQQRNGNTGFAGGMERQPFQLGSNTGAGGGMWDIYNTIATPQPQRQLLY